MNNVSISLKHVWNWTPMHESLFILSFSLFNIVLRITFSVVCPYLRNCVIVPYILGSPWEILTFSNYCEYIFVKSLVLWKYIFQNPFTCTFLCSLFFVDWGKYVFKMKWGLGWGTGVHLTLVHQKGKVKRNKKNIYWQVEGVIEVLCT